MQSIRVDAPIFDTLRHKELLYSKEWMSILELFIYRISIVFYDTPPSFNQFALF